jgi:uncharacterized NAD(P)/FAD-binding protein YdhS
MKSPDRSMPDYDLLIIGGGFAACSALAGLAHSNVQKLRVAILVQRQSGTNDQQNELGCGLAYSHQDPAHLLNAAHWNMSLLDDDPDGFTRWLAARSGSGAMPDFAARASYGAFLSEQWIDCLKVLAARGVQVSIIPRNAQAIASIGPCGVTVVDVEGTSYSAAALLVCEGPSMLTQQDVRHPNLISPLWPGGLKSLKGASGHVVIIGTGLSGVDAAISALAESSVAKVTMLSRDGRLPLSHDVAARQKQELLLQGGPFSVLQAIRAASATTKWQAVMNALRSQSNSLWRAWSVKERRAALRHLGGLWAAHRNRLPPDVLEQLQTERANGRLEVIKSQVTVDVDEMGRLCITLDGDHAPIKPDWVVDARGFARVTATTETLCGRALRDGHFALSDLGYGVAANSCHRVTPSHLAPIHVVGAARMGDLIETAGAPEVRTQVAQSLEALLA